MSHFKTDFINNDNKFKVLDDDTLGLIKPAIFKDKLDKKMQIETHTFYIHVCNLENKKTFVVMIQILLSNVLDGLQKSTELLFSVMNADGGKNTFLKQKVKKPITTGKSFIVGKNLKYKIEQKYIALSYEDDVLSINLQFGRGTKSVKILPFEDYKSTKLTNGEIEHVYTLGLNLDRTGYIKYINKSIILFDDVHKASTSHIIAMQNGLPYKLVDLWNFVNTVDFESGRVELAMEYGFYDEVLSTCVKLDNEEISVDYGLINGVGKKSLPDKSLECVRKYEILKELPRFILVLMKKLTNNDPVLEQYCSVISPSIIYERTRMKKK